jgi:hypothetical protein
MRCTSQGKHCPSLDCDIKTLVSVSRDWKGTKKREFINVIFVQGTGGKFIHRMYFGTWQLYKKGLHAQ